MLSTSFVTKWNSDNFRPCNLGLLTLQSPDSDITTAKFSRAAVASSFVENVCFQRHSASRLFKDDLAAGSFSENFLLIVQPQYFCAAVLHIRARVFF